MKTTTDPKLRPLQRLAREIATAIFTNGQGQVAVRIDLELRSGASGGGWGLGPCADQIEKALIAALNREAE